MNDAKKFMSEIITKLNTAGFTGGFYKYKKEECSCCYGRKDSFFQINENMPHNWSGNYYKISYDYQDKDKASEFRKIANKLAKNMLES